MKKIFLFLTVISLICTGVQVSAKNTFELHSDVIAIKENVSIDLKSRSACLMEPDTGEIIYEINADEHLEPASVTKIMSVLLIYEALEDGKITKSDIVTASETASNMGGSQIWLEPGEQMTIDDMLKAILVVSANDCTVAVAEHLCGSEQSFVNLMNTKAKELGMNNTNFVNSTGLPAENHYTCSRDIAIMTRELIKHDDVFNYTLIWMDTLRGGEFGLSNTNKLIRFYPGANGMKTGFTDSAGYCMSATAERDGMKLISVVMKSPTSDERFADAKKLLDYGFANFCVYKMTDDPYKTVKVVGGKENEVKISYNTHSILLPKGRERLVESVTNIPEKINAPVKEGQIIGNVTYSLDGEQIATVDVFVMNGIEKAGFFDIFKKTMACITMKR